MYKFIKIVPFPEQLFYMDRMVGYEQEPKILVQVEREKGDSNSVRVTFQTIVKEVSRCDQTSTVRRKVMVSISSILDQSSNEVTKRVYSRKTESYQKLSQRLKDEIETMLNEQLDEVIVVLKKDKLSHWLKEEELLNI